MKQPIVLSDRLESWLTDGSAKTLAGLNHVFAEKSMGIVYFVLMFPAALPLPTGGFSHVLEAIAMLVSVQLIMRRRSLWLPKSWRKKELTSLKRPRTIKFLTKYVRFVERYTRPRLRGFMHKDSVLISIGCMMFLFALASALAPLFSGIDTIPAIGAVLMALAIIFDDFVIMLAGLLMGGIGIAVVWSADAALIKLLLKL